MKVKDAYESLSMSPIAPPFGNSISYGEKEQSKSSKSEKNVIMASPIQVASPLSAIRRPKNHIYPRYLPKITHQELQQLSGQLKCTIVPLFEKTLTISDVGRLGRMVLPKPCVETYFPPISQPEGIPLQIEDVKGNKLVFRFRFWPNNSSRIYLLEGVNPWIRSMQLQAGDFVTFSRMEPGEKLIMWFRKASISSDQVNDFTVSKGLKRGLPQQELVAHEKKRASDIDSKSKRLQLIDNQDPLMLKLTWEEVQGFLQPSPTVIPNIVVIDDHVFEEYDEPPIIAKKGIFINRMNEQWIQCDMCSEWKKLEGCVENLCDQTRCSCSASMN
ncbi:B3 domain-containing transcription repressor VAL1-like [Cicer arietinum]|uniref:B3 domain-containing transcription repressor VAL1-like n=1 Tax=Cicer arietinum TaxID=3827 RepID=UPI00032A601E